MIVVPRISCSSASSGVAGLIDWVIIIYAFGFNCLSSRGDILGVFV